MMKPLDGIKVLDFSQFLAGPACGLRLADLGAEVIKVEKHITGDICRTLYVSNVRVGNESTIFHAINRNKKSVSVNLKSKVDIEQIYKLVKDVDVIIQNFRPGVAERLGIDYESLKEINPQIVYGSVSGYGTAKGEWFNSPGQDLLAQSRTGIMWHADTVLPSPMGLSIGDMSAAYDLTCGILTLLFRKMVSGQGGLVEVSLAESLINLQACEISIYLNSGYKNNETDKPSGIVKTSDGYINILMDQENIRKLTPLFDNVPFVEMTSTKVLEFLAENGISSAPVLNLEELRQEEHYQSLGFEQTVKSHDEISVRTTRCPIKIDGEIFTSEIGAPAIGEHNYLLRNL